MTPSALTAPWVLFEAGAIAKDPDKTYACTLLIDVKIEDVRDPLSQFTATPAHDREEMLKLVKTLNDALQAEKRPDDQVKKSFDKWWPDLEEQFKNLPADEPTKTLHRDERDILAEILTLTRQTSITVVDSHESLSELAGFVTQSVVAASLSPTWASVMSSGDVDAMNSRYIEFIKPRGTLADLSRIIKEPKKPSET